MLVTMTQHFWQQTQFIAKYYKEIRQKYCNKSPYIGLAKMAKSAFLAKSAFFDERRRHFWWQNP